MSLKQLWWSGLVAAVLGGLVSVTAVAAGQQFIPLLSMREGALRSLGIPWADGYIAYLTLLNERDGGVNGVTLVWDECETVYDVNRSCHGDALSAHPGYPQGQARTHHL